MVFDSGGVALGLSNLLAVNLRRGILGFGETSEVAGDCTYREEKEGCRDNYGRFWMLQVNTPKRDAIY